MPSSTGKSTRRRTLQGPGAGRLFVLVAVIAVSIAGCSSGSGSSGASTQNGSSSPGKVKDWSDVSALVKAAKSEGTLNVYVPNQYAAVMSGFMKTYPWAKINDTDLVPEAAAQKLATEVSAGIGNADAVNLYTNQVSQFSSQGQLLAFHVPNEKNIPASQADPAGQFHTWYVAPYVLLYNTKRLSGGPKDLTDLTAATWKGKLVMDNPALGGPASEVLAALKPTLSSQWQSWLQKLNANGPTLTDTSGTSYGDVVRGDSPLCLCAYHDFTSQASGTPVADDLYGQSKNGTGVVQQALAMVVPTTAPHPAMAALWVNWLLSAAGQEAVVAGGRSPVDTSVPGAGKVSLPAGTKVTSDQVLASYLKDQTPYTSAYKAVFGS